MNLIEQLGGYEASKDILLRKRYDHIAYSVDSGIFYDHDATEHGGIDVQDLDGELLEYRRANNIFEVGDRVVKMNPKLKCAIAWPVLGVYKNGGVWLDYKGFCWNLPRIRHATDEEIKAGHRL